MMMPGRKYTGTNGYRYGFNGKENDNEVKGEGNQQDYGMRIYDPRVGRFLSVDPLTKMYPFYTPFQFAGNSPILSLDIDGMEPKVNTNKTVTDAGHGVNETGTKSTNDGTTEASLALKVETETNKSLTTMGVNNTRTRTEEFVKTSENQVNYRCKIAKNSGADVFVSHHFNVAANDIWLMYHPVQTKEGVNGSSEEFEANSLKLAGYLKEELAKVYTDRKILLVKGTRPSANYNTLGVLRQFDQVDNAAILIEFGDINNTANVTFVNANAAQIGNAVATGMYRYLHNGEMPPAQSKETPVVEKKATPPPPAAQQKVKDPNEIHSWADFKRELSRWMNWKPW
jgi:RHS repeat-associated protein